MCWTGTALFVTYQVNVAAYVIATLSIFLIRIFNYRYSHKSYFGLAMPLIDGLEFTKYITIIIKVT